MRRTYVISDFFYRLSHTLKRNRFTVLLYSLLCLLFLVVGVAVGANMSDKTEYVLRNGAAIFKFLRGDSGIVAFFFIDFFMGSIYCIFTVSMFINRVTVFISLAPCAYRSYVLGVNTCVIIVVFSVSALPMLFVTFVPVCIIEIVVLCMLSYRCFCFTALNRRCFPAWSDIKCYYKGILSYIFALAIFTLIKAITLILFGSALIGVI
ncbi:MAG: hypothetical protein K2L88_05470 [Clostridiales bacterium]|nr:hypothetical protein [Clostridiales bacterium]